jgi:hypothetical protein
MFNSYVTFFSEDNYTYIYIDIPWISHSYSINIPYSIFNRYVELPEAKSKLGGVRVPLEPPQQPSSLADAKHMEVTRVTARIREEHCTNKLAMNKNNMIDWLPSGKLT